MSNEIIQATPRDFYVYLHRRATTGRIFYVGKGCGTRAFSKHGRSAYWKRIVGKHGFTAEVVQDGLQEWAAFELECDLIALYGRQDTGDGALINATSGGDGSSGVVHSEEARKKRSVLSKAMWQNSEHREKTCLSMKASLADPLIRAKMSETQKKRLSDPVTREKMRVTNRAIFDSQEVRDKISAFHKQRFTCIETRRAQAEIAAKARELWKKPILCIETQQVFLSGQEAIAFLRSNGSPKASAGCISTCCHGKTKSAYGYRWAFADSMDKVSSISSAEHIYTPHNKKRSVICVETGKVFHTISDAAEFLRQNGNKKASQSSLSLCCNGKQKSAYGFTWAFSA